MSRASHGWAFFALVGLGVFLPGWASAQDAPQAAAEGKLDASPLRDELRGILGVPGGLTAQAAGQRAAAASVAAERSRFQVEAAEAETSQVLWASVPTLTLTARTQRLSSVPSPAFGPPGEEVSFPVPLYNHFLNAGLAVPISDYVFRTLSSLRGADANEEAAGLEERAARVQAAANARITYYQWVQAKLQTVLTRRALAEAEAQLQRLTALTRAGRASEADRLSASAFLASAELTATQAETAENLAEQNLRIAIDAAPGERLLVAEDVLSRPARLVNQAGTEARTLFREALSKRLEVRSFERLAYSLEQAASVEHSRALPEVHVVGNLTYANPNSRVFPLAQEWNGSWDVGLQAVWRVNDVGGASARGRRLAAQASQARADRRRLEQGVWLEIVSALGELKRAHVSVDAARRGEVAAEAALVARRALQQYGRATALELLEAETAHLRSRSSLVEAHVALRVAGVRLDHAVGRDVAALASAR